MTSPHPPNPVGHLDGLARRVCNCACHQPKASS